MGDKTKLPPLPWRAHYATPLLVVMGTTLGMLIADVPAVFVGDKLANKNPNEAGSHHCGGGFRRAGRGHLAGRR